MFSEPKIFLVDLGEDVAKAVLKHWDSVGTGTLGKPYKIESSSDWMPVIQHHALGDYIESDIVVVDLHRDILEEKHNGRKHTPDGETDIWAKCDVGWIDARARSAIREKAGITRIVNSGGVLIIFAGPDSPMDFCMGSKDYHNRLNTVENIKGGVWNLLPDNHNLNVIEDSGSVIKIVDDTIVGSMLRRHVKGARFNCTVRNKYSNNQWITLAINKFESPVALMSNYGKGCTFIFPQIADKASFVEDLLTNVLPELIPNLFPEIDKGKWTHHSEYEIDEILLLEAEKQSVLEQVTAKLESIEKNIVEIRTSEGWIQDLLTGTGDELVSAVKKAFEFIGFENVIDMDELRDAQGIKRREDLRIDGDPTLIIDIKGVSGKASDEDLMQAGKHALISIRESGNTHIRGLAVVNQQRYLPPLDRDNQDPFRPEMQVYAEESQLGLLTSFDLYRLLVNMRRHNWLFEDIKPLFYSAKRIFAVPHHYKYIGNVSKVFKSVLAMHILDNQISVGDRLAVEGEIYFEEVDVSSIKVNDISVECAVTGDKAGFIWGSTRLKLREGMRVFAIPKVSSL